MNYVTYLYVNILVWLNSLYFPITLYRGAVAGGFNIKNKMEKSDLCVVARYCVLFNKCPNHHERALFAFIAPTPGLLSLTSKGRRLCVGIQSIYRSAYLFIVFFIRT